MLWHFSRSDADHWAPGGPTSLPASLEGLVPESDLGPPRTGVPRGASITSPTATGEEPPGQG
jgi:hypothetical protein